MDIKSIVSKMTLTQFNKRFIEEHQGIRDRITNKIYYCPGDLGFNFTRDNCNGGLECKKCWAQAKRRLVVKQVFKRKKKNQ